MISLKRLNGVLFFLNAELIEQVESTPDTVITLTTGNNIVVRESAAEVVERILNYRRAVAHENKKKTLVKNHRMTNHKAQNPKECSN